MWLIVGLGNPGKEYLFTRHNIGFMALDFFTTNLGLGSWSQECKALTLKFKLKTESQKQETNLILAKPQTYMNRSGESVQAILHYYKIPPQQLLVVHDDIDQTFGKIKFQKNRGHAGHNGVRSISELIGTTDYIRLKIGVGRPSHPQMEIANFVLNPFSKEEEPQLGNILNTSCDAIKCLINDGLNKASSKFNMNVIHD